MDEKKAFPEWAKTLYRGVRAGVAAGVSSIVALKLILNQDLLKKETLIIIAIAFGSGFIVAFGKVLRAWLDKMFDFDENSLIARIMPI